MQKIVIGIGEILWDIFTDRKVLGGAPANFAYHVSQLGYDGYAVSAVGNDLPGDELVGILSQKKMGMLIERTDYPTGTVQINLDTEGIPQYEIRTDVAWDHIGFTPEVRRLAAQASAVCFGTLAQRSPASRKTIRQVLETVPGNALKIYDINLRQEFYTREIIAESLGMADILKINEDELAVLSGMWEIPGEEAEVCRTLADRFGLRIVILTRGAQGSCLFSGKEESCLDTPKVKVADTVGAGDSFTAGFVAALLGGASLREAHAQAVSLSAYVCTRQGAMPEHAGWNFAG